MRFYILRLMEYSNDILHPILGGLGKLFIIGLFTISGQIQNTLNSIYIHILPEPVIQATIEHVEPEEPTINSTIEEAAIFHNIDEKLIKAIIYVESKGDHNAISPKGAKGLMQIMPGTAKDLGIDPTNPIQNIYGGTKYIKTLLVRFKNIELALAAYNAGPGRIIEYKGIPPFKETRLYVKKVMKEYSRLKNLQYETAQESLIPNRSSSNRSS